MDTPHLLKTLLLVQTKDPFDLFTVQGYVFNSVFRQKKMK